MQFPAMKHREYQKYAQAANDGNFVKTHTYCQTNAGRSPETSRRGQAFDLAAGSDNDGTGTEKTDTASA